MRDDYWKSLLKKWENFYYPQDSNEDEVFKNGIEELKLFVKLVVDTPKRPLEKHQFNVLIQYTPILLKEAFGSQYVENNQEKLSRLCSIDKFLYVLLVVIKRQHGKTEIMCRLAAASIVAFTNKESKFEHNEWLLVSYKGDHVKENLKRCVSHIEKYQAYWKDKFKIIGGKATQRNISLLNMENPNDVRVLKIYTGNLDGLGGKKYFFDEVGKVTQEKVEVQLAPQLMIKNCSAFLTTSLKSFNCWLPKWLDEQRNKLCIIINESEICRDCLDRFSDADAMKCVHKRKLQAHFVDPKKTEAVIALMPRGQAMRHMYCVIPNVKGQLWTERYLKEKIFIFAQNHNSQTKNINWMFVDPSMTSEHGSETGSCIINANGPNIYIRYLNSSITKSNTRIVNYVIDDIKFFFSKFKDQTIVLFVESNTVNHGEEIKKELDKLRYIERKQVHFVKGIKTSKTRFGVVKVGGDERLFAEILGNKMYNSRIFLDPNFVSRYKRGVHEVKDLLVEQCLNVRLIPSKNSNKIIICSKKDLNDKPANNDLYISFVSIMKWYTYWERPNELKAFIRKCQTLQ